MNPEISSKPLEKKHKIGLYLLLSLFIIFGIIVELRGALQSTRKTDAGVYFRAAWAIRTGNDIYSISDDRNWHYIYPPLFAITMAPLADPPHNMERPGYLPYPISIALWYIITLVLGFIGIHILADALEKKSRDPSVKNQPRFCLRWWALRILPILIMLLPIGRSQARGQIGLIISFILCGASAAILNNRRFAAGIWLSVAICIKMIPALLLLVPIWRRDYKMLSGILLGLFIGMILIPIIAMGPENVFKGYESFYKETISAGITGDTEGSRGKELTGITSTDSNSPMVIIHNIMYPNSQTRPKTATIGIRRAHWLISLFLIFATLISAGRNKSGSFREVLFLNAFVPAMFITSPVFHPHYVSMALPLVIIILAILWDQYGFPNMPLAWKIIFWSVAVSHLLTSIDGGIFLYLRDFGVVLFTTILLWAGSITLLYKSAKPR